MTRRDSGRPPPAVPCDCQDPGVRRPLLSDSSREALVVGRFHAPAISDASNSGRSENAWDWLMMVAYTSQSQESSVALGKVHL